MPNRWQLHGFATVVTGEVMPSFQQLHLYLCRQQKATFSAAAAAHERNFIQV